MTIKELLEKIQDLEFTEEQVKHIKKCLGIKENKKWIPKKEENYWYVNSYGGIDYSIFINDKIDNFRLNTNNYFKTVEEAKFKLEQIKVYNELKNFADENNEEIDLNNYKVEKYIIEYDLENKEVYCDWYTSSKSIGQIYFSSRELAKQAIEKIGVDRIKKYLFEVDLC